MKKLDIKLRYCYGINKLDFSFDFENRTFAIYAPNGVMKTSFAKTFDDIANNRNTIDKAFPKMKTEREILIDGVNITEHQVFVVKPYDKDYCSDKMSTLVANSRLKEEYDDIHKDISEQKEIILKKLRKISGVSGRSLKVEDVISEIFNKDFFEFLLDIEDEIPKSNFEQYSKIKYIEIFNDTVQAFLSKKEVKELIIEYIEKYDELVQDSPYLKKEFNLYNAETVASELSSNKFFDAGHSVNLSDGNSKNEYMSNEELSNVFEDAKKKVLDNEHLQEKFEEINKKLSNTKLRAFRDYLLENMEILPELGDLEELKKKIWVSYISSLSDEVKELISLYKKSQMKIKSLVEKAREEETLWEDVVKIFNKRFTHLPFNVEIVNKDDVILAGEIPTISFRFKDKEETTTFTNKDDLLKVLSTGEQRALYILNIIFEVEARKLLTDEILYIFDDIADSFDYKNKYAIIEYLKYISEVNNFFMIVLTHNFDFLRTIRSRGIVSYKQCLIARKTDSEIKLDNAEYLNNPFFDWKSNVDSSNLKFIATIPFARNLIEYTKGEEHEDYILLTSLLHHKCKTDSIKISDIKSIFEEHLDISLNRKNINKKVVDLIFNTADQCLKASEGINLENKIVLSIATRLKAEIFMKNEISDKNFTSELEGLSNQTWHLLHRYSEEFNNKKKEISILKRVTLITPANIHINSFMYEPILDMGDFELREIYTDVSNL